MSKYAIISDDVMLKDKVVIVTGASSGIGRATAIALASHGCKVAIGARRTSNLEKLQDEIEKSGGQAFAQKLDVSDRRKPYKLTQLDQKSFEKKIIRDGGPKNADFCVVFGRNLRIFSRM